MTIEEAITQVKNGERIVLGHGAVSPAYALEELVCQKERFTKLPIYHLIYMGTQYHMQEENAPYFEVFSPFFSGKEMREAYLRGQVHHMPMHFSHVPKVFQPGGTFEPDWAFIQVTPPNDQGEYSLSLSSDYTWPAAKRAKKVLAIVNDQLPFVAGPYATLTADEIYITVEHSSTPYASVESHPSEKDLTIAKYCADLIPDEATLQIGIGAIPDAVLALLTDRKDLGIHTELLTPGVKKLIDTGAVTNAKKGIHDGKIIGTFVIATQELYDWLHNNNDFELYPVDYVNDPRVIGQNHRMISVNSCTEIDLYGQVCSEKIGGLHYSGSGGQFDYVRGVRFADEGKSIIAVSSTARGGTVSRIVPTLTKGNVVTTHRNDVDYIVTEYGVAHLYGKTERERAKALIEIAHPDFREDLERGAYELFKTL